MKIRMDESNVAIPPLGTSDAKAFPPAFFCALSRIYFNWHDDQRYLAYSAPESGWAFADPYGSSRPVMFRNVVSHDGKVFEVRSVFRRAFSLYAQSAACVSRNVASLGEGCFCGCGALHTVAFEWGSHLGEIGAHAFASCVSLRSIAIPSFVGRLGTDCLSDCKSLRSATFERPSRLARISGYAFSNCRSLTWISIPASVTAIEDRAFYGSGIRSIEIEDGSVSFRVVEECLVDFEVRSLVWVIGSSESIRIPSSIEELRPWCCSLKTALRTVEFESDSNLRSIDGFAFAFCNSLVSICIPSSVEVLPEDCFYLCSSLRTVTFGVGSKLRRTECGAFRLCPSLKSVSVPASVEVIGQQPVTFISRP
jgi:hypothetical protein